MNTAEWLRDFQSRLDEFARLADQLGRMPAPQDEEDVAALLDFRERLKLTHGGFEQHAADQLARVVHEATRRATEKCSDLIAGSDGWLGSLAGEGHPLLVWGPDLPDGSYSIVNHPHSDPACAVALRFLPPLARERVRQGLSPDGFYLLGHDSPHVIFPAERDPKPTPDPTIQYWHLPPRTWFAVPALVERTRYWRQRQDQDRRDRDNYSAYLARLARQREEASMSPTERLQREVAELKRQLAEREPTHA